MTLQTLGNACAAHSGQRHWAAVGKRDRERLLVGIAPFVIAIGEDKTAASGPPSAAERSARHEAFGAGVKSRIADFEDKAQRIKVRMRLPAAEMTTGSFDVGAAFQRGR